MHMDKQSLGVVLAGSSTVFHLSSNDSRRYFSPAPLEFNASRRHLANIMSALSAETPPMHLASKNGDFLWLALGNLYACIIVTFKLILKCLSLIIGGGGEGLENVFCDIGLFSRSHTSTVNLEILAEFYLEN